MKNDKSVIDSVDDLTFKVLKGTQTQQGVYQP